MRVFVGYDDDGKLVQASKTVRGGKRVRSVWLHSSLLGRRPCSGKLTVAELLDELSWALERNGQTQQLSLQRTQAGSEFATHRS